MARLPGALFLSILLASTTLAQNQPAQKVTTSKTPSLSMPMVAPVFLEDAEFTSTVTLVNDAIDGLSARLLVLDPHGVAAAQKEFKLPGHTSLPIRIHDLLEESGSAVTTGSVIVIPQPVSGMPIGGQLSITSRVGSIPSYIEEEMLMPDEKTTPGMFRTSALAVKGSPIIALKSLAQSTQTVTLECFSEKAAPAKGTVQLPSGESMLVAACDVSQTGRTAVSEAISDNPAVDRGAVGVAITTTAPSGDLIGYGFAAYRDDRGPYFTSLNLTDPAAMLSSTTIFTGIPAGPTEVLQQTSFKPELAITNFSAKPAHVSVTMATTTAGKTKTDVTQTLLLPPRSSKTVKLPPHGDPGMANSLVVHSTLAPGEVVSQFVAWGDSLFRTVEMQAKDNDSIQNGGGHPWTIEPGTDSTLLLFNHSTDGPKRFNVLVNSGKQLWQNHYMLAPMETKAVSIRSIVEKQTPDEKGKKLDKATISGQLGWWTRLPKWGKGRLMVSSPRDGLARSYSCGTCAALCNFGAYLDPYVSTIIAVNGYGDLGNIEAQQCVLTCTQQCGGTRQGPSLEATYTWTSNNTSVATVSGHNFNPSASFRGVAAGSTSGHFVATDGQCTTQGNAPVAVAKLTCSGSVTRGASATCTVTPSSGVTVSGWKFQDGSGDTVTRTANTGSLTWSGAMVTSGTVSVTATASGVASPLTASITVSSRNWHTGVPSPVEVPNGTFVSLPVPPQPTGLDSGLGQAREIYSYPGASSTFISDNGPNQGYGYYATQMTFTNTYNYEINPDLENTGSTFYSKQCGNYNAQTKPSGFISGPSLLTQTRRHEYNSATQSHYAFYSNSISGQNNPGDYLESRIATPGTSPTTFDNATGAGITSRYQNISADISLEPFPVNDDASGNFLGNINYAPYTSCN